MSLGPRVGAVVLKDAVAARAELVDARQNAKLEVSTASLAGRELPRRKFRAAAKLPRNNSGWDTAKEERRFFIGSKDYMRLLLIVWSVCFGGKSTRKCKSTRRGRPADLC